MQNVLLEGFTALIAGMSTVFTILILISLLIGSFKFIIPSSDSEKKTGRPKAKVDNIESTIAVTNKVGQTDSKDMRPVIAAISVALAASLNTTVDKLKVRSFRRL